MALKRTPRSQDAAPAQVSRVDLAEIERVLRFMTSHSLEELEYRSGEFQVWLKRQPSVGVAHVAAAPVFSPHPSAPTPAPAAAGLVPSPPPAESAPDENLHIVKSPIVGTFYSAPSPDSPPFVKPGDTVKRGQVLCIVEAMKLMNEIDADQAGEVVRQLAENGQPVEYGQPLFALKPLAEA